MKRKLNLKNVFVFLIIAAILSFGTYATWSYMLSASITGNVVSLAPDEVLYFSEGISDFDIINASYQAVSVNKTIEIKNDNGIIPLVFSAVETKIDINDSCTDFENDVSVSYYLDDLEIYNNDNVTFYSGTHDFTIVINALKGSCPQNVTMDILFS